MRPLVYMAAGAALAVLCGCISPAANAVLCGIEDFDKVLAADAKIKAWSCGHWAETVAKHPGLQTYCNHIPADTVEALITWNRVFWAMIWETPS